MGRRALEELAAPYGAGEFSIAHRDLPAHRDDARAAFDFPTFERVVVHGLRLRFHRELPAIGGIVDHEVRIAPDGDGTFTREKTKEFRGIRARDSDERLQIEPAL